MPIPSSRMAIFGNVYVPAAMREEFLYVYKAISGGAWKCVGVVERDVNESLMWIEGIGNGEEISVDGRENAGIRVVVNDVDTNVERGSIGFASEVS